MRVQLPVPEGFAQSTADKTLEELNVLQDQYDSERLAMLAKAQVVADKRKELMAIEDAAHHGLTPEEYLSIKKQAQEEEVPLDKALAKARKIIARGRALQVVKAKPAMLGVKTKRS